MMKLQSVLAIFVGAALFCGAGTGCGGKRPQKGGENVVQIRYWKAGYGDEWLCEAVEKFNALYSDEGYSAKIEESSGTITTDEIVAQTKDYQKNNIDLYFTSGSAALLKLIDASPQILRTSEYTLMEDLSDLYKQKAIGLDKEKESLSIEEKMSDTAKLYASYHGKIEKWQNTRFLYQWTSASAGLLYNEKVLDKYGIGEVPRTTKELKAAFDKISEDGKEDKVYPAAWGGNNAAGYWQYVTETWFAQYTGYEKYLDFYRLKPETGETKTDGWRVYDNLGWKYAFENLGVFCSTSYAAPGTLTTVDHLGAQDLFVKGKAAFCTTGDWMYNEMCKDPAYSDLLDDIRVMRTPVMSELGTKLGLHSDPAVCEQILSEMIKGVDEGESNSEIVSAVNAKYAASVTDSQAESVRAARGIYYDLGYEHQGFIPYHSDAKDAAKLFLRFIASNDFQRVYREKAHGNLPYTYTLAEGEKVSEYQKSLDVLTHSAESQGICEANQLSEIRAAAGITALPFVGSWVTLVKGMAAGNEKYSAENVYANNLKAVSGENWELLLETAGIN